MRHTTQPPTQQPEWDLLLRFLPAGWAAQARKLGAFRRARKIRSPQALLRLVLMHAGVGLSLQRTAETADQAGLAEMSKIAVFKRVRVSGAWLAWLVSKMLEARVERPVIAGYQARIVDGTSVVGPAGGVQLRLHYSIGISDLKCDGLVITDNRAAESLEHFTVTNGDLLIADRIYARAKGVAHVKHAGGDVVVRLGSTSLTLYDEERNKIERLRWLRQLQPGQPTERFAQFRDEEGQWISGRMCAIRLSEAQAHRARKRCVKKAQRGGHKLRETTLEAAGYLCLFTTAPEQLLSTEIALEFYRARWQIELAFKRLKSLLHADQLRDTSLESAKIWLHAKMLYALLLHAYLDEAGAFSPWGYPLPPEQTPAPAGRPHSDTCLGTDRTRPSSSGAGDPRAQPIGPDELAGHQHTPHR